jgi:hypothetical protein
MLTAPATEHTAMMRSVAQRRIASQIATRMAPDPMPRRLSPMTRYV